MHSCKGPADITSVGALTSRPGNTESPAPGSEPKLEPSPRIVYPDTSRVHSAPIPRRCRERGAVNLGGLVVLTLTFLAGAYLIVHVALALLGWKGLAAVAFLVLFVALLSVASSTEERR